MANMRYPPVEPTMASHDITYDCYISRHLHLGRDRPLDVDTTKFPLASHAPGLLSIVYPQHRDLQRLSRHGLRAFPPGNAIHLPGRHDSHLPHNLRSRVQ